MRDLVGRALNDDATVYAIWPGKYRADLFLVDDVTRLADFVVVAMVAP